MSQYLVVIVNEHTNEVYVTSMEADCRRSAQDAALRRRFRQTNGEWRKATAQVPIENPTAIEVDL